MSTTKRKEVINFGLEVEKLLKKIELSQSTESEKALIVELNRYSEKHHLEKNTIIQILQCEKFTKDTIIFEKFLKELIEHGKNDIVEFILSRDEIYRQVSKPAIKEAAQKSESRLRLVLENKLASGVFTDKEEEGIGNERPTLRLPILSKNTEISRDTIISWLKDEKSTIETKERILINYALKDHLSASQWMESFNKLPTDESKRKVLTDLLINEKNIQVFIKKFGLCGSLSLFSPMDFLNETVKKILSNPEIYTDQENTKILAAVIESEYSSRCLLESNHSLPFFTPKQIEAIGDKFSALRPLILDKSQERSPAAIKRWLMEDKNVDTRASILIKFALKEHLSASQWMDAFNKMPLV